MEASSSSSSRSRATVAPRYKSTTMPATTTTATMQRADDNKRLNCLLENLNFKFINCTFTYKSNHLTKHGVGVECPPKKPTRFKKFKSTLSNTLERISKSVESGLELQLDVEFKNSIFIPKNEEELVQSFIRKGFPGIRIKFENCRFMKRGSSILEKVAKKLRGFFGIIFELTYVDNTVAIEEYVFRLKDISFVSEYIQERIIEKG